MKSPIVLTIFFVLIVSVSVSATIIVIPGDYLTIQEGINASEDGDTVLVKPGIYEENIIFNIHRIVLASMFLTTGNPEYIEETIIDGTSSGRVVWIGGDSTTVIIGFTIQNGYSSEGAGIYSYGNAIISNNIIRYNESYGYYELGGGIFCNYSNPIIRFNVIANNSACWGGGIALNNSSAIISNNIIRNNLADP